MRIFHINPSNTCWFFSFLSPTNQGLSQPKRPTPPSAASDAISDASEPEPTVQPVAPPKTMGASPPMAVPSVQGFAKWNLERCPEVLEAASLGTRCRPLGWEVAAVKHGKCMKMIMYGRFVGLEGFEIEFASIYFLLLL